MDPLFSDEPTHQGNQAHSDKQGYLLPPSKTRVNPSPEGGANPAADLIRNKLDALFTSEPNARTELAETKQAHVPRSRHQQFMYDLSTSGKSLAEIQTAWHNYYVGLPDTDKHEVWQEFYANNNRTPSAYSRFVQQQAPANTHAAAVQHEELPNKPIIGAHHSTPDNEPKSPAGKRSLAAIKKQVARRVRASNSAQLKAKQHLKSLAFGAGIGSLVLLIFLFSFFNEVVIAPFIRPNANASTTPIILDSNSVAPSATPEVIIPKISVQLPIVYGNQTVNEADLQKSMEDGVIHYPTTFMPGQHGNTAFFGHSSNNIFNKGKYKFAFVLLHELEPGDLFYLTYGGKVYAYKVFQKRIVEPTDTWVLNNVPDKTATATLITCDPPGTSLHRLVVWGEQINPDPNTNIDAPAPTTTTTSEAKQELPGNGPTLWSRFRDWLF